MGFLNIIIIITAELFKNRQGCLIHRCSVSLCKKMLSLIHPLPVCVASWFCNITLSHEINLWKFWRNDIRFAHPPLTVDATFPLFDVDVQQGPPPKTSWVNKLASPVCVQARGSAAVMRASLDANSVTQRSM